MKEADLRLACLALMATTDVVYLTTHEVDGYPRVRAMLNLRCKSRFPDHSHLYATQNDDFMIYISTNTASQKTKAIQANPKIGLYFCHSDGYFFGLSLIGDAEIITDMAIKESVWAPGWEQYYPTTGYADDPDYTLLRVFPKKAQGWNRCETFEFDINP